MKILLWSLVVVTGGAFAVGLAAYREGRFADARHVWRDAATQDGDSTAPELWFNLALAALRSGDLRGAAVAAEHAAARGGAEFRAERDFILGNVAWERCLLAEITTFRPDATPGVFDLAITQAAAAEEWWQFAAVSRADWPAARRNAERALLKAEDLRRKKDEAAASNDRRRDGSQPGAEPDLPKPDAGATPQPIPEPQGNAAEPAPQDGSPAPLTTELSTADVRRLLDTIRQKEAEKLRLRRSRREAEHGQAERDW